MAAPEDDPARIREVQRVIGVLQRVNVIAEKVFTAAEAYKVCPPKVVLRIPITELPVVAAGVEKQISGTRWDLERVREGVRLGLRTLAAAELEEMAKEYADASSVAAALPRTIRKWRKGSLTPAQKAEVAKFEKLTKVLQAQIEEVIAGVGALKPQPFDDKTGLLKGVLNGLVEA